MEPSPFPQGNPTSNAAHRFLAHKNTTQKHGPKENLATGSMFMNLWGSLVWGSIKSGWLLSIYLSSPGRTGHEPRREGRDRVCSPRLKGQELLSWCSSLSLQQTPPKGQYKSAFLPWLQTSGPNSAARGGGGATLCTQELLWGQSSPVPFFATDIVHDGAEEGGGGG